MLLKVLDFVEIFEKLPYIPKFVLQECAEAGNRKIALLMRKLTEAEVALQVTRHELAVLRFQLTRTKRNGHYVAPPPLEIAVADAD